MSTLRAGERPVHHFRAGRLRAEPPVTAARPEVRMRAEPQLTARPAQVAPEPERQTAVEPAMPVFEPERLPDEGLAGFEVAAAAIARASDVLKRPVAATPRARPEAPALVPGAEAGFLNRLAQLRPEPQRSARGSGERRDPAPSRAAYRMERLWLTPMFRRFMRYGLPVLLVTAVAGGYLASDARRDRIAATFASLRQQVENRPEFMVTHMAIDGASGPVDSAIRQLATVPLPASSFQLDLQAMRGEIEKIDAVERVTLRVKSGGVLAVAVTERKPAILMRVGDRLEMLDATGHRVATLLDRSKRPDLPVIAGEGAEGVVPEALAILAAAQPVLPRVRGLVRMGDRRWDLVLDRDQTIMLPEAGAVEAMERAMAIDAAEEMLARDVAALDLRNADRPTLRLAAGPSRQ